MSAVAGMAKEAAIRELLESINVHKHADDVAHVEIHGNEVLGAHLVEGLEVEAESMSDGVSVKIRVRRGVTIEKPVQFCFGLMHETGTQRILIRTHIEEDARASFIAHCTFPNAVDVRHLMDADITLDRDATLSYFERHVHGPEGGVTVVPKTRITLGEGARFTSEFELIKGAAGVIDLDYEAICAARSVLDMKARIFGRLHDRIRLREAASLDGEGARGVITSHIALKDEARAEVLSELNANAPLSRGHVDCKEIVQGAATARAVPIVQVNNPKAHVTHEASIGSVDSKQLQTLMARGLSEDAATDLIIQGLLA